MLITGFPAGPLGANCYVVAIEEDGECVVIDPGQRATDPLADVLVRHRLTPAAVLATHGHFDHVASAAAVCTEHEVPLYIGADDEYMLADPWAALSPELSAGVQQLLGPGESLEGMRPFDVRTFDSAHDEALDLAGIHVDVLPVPGHTTGSVTFRITPEDGPAVLFTGDTLFAGTIGRTDMPGGSSSGILRSIADQLLALPDETVVLPGHGGASTIGAERESNPFLR